MSEELLRSAARALRETPSPEGQGATFTRARVMASLHQKRRQRTTRRALLWPLAAILVGSTAWAGASGKLPEAVQAMVRAAGMRLGVSAGAPTPAALPAAAARVHGAAPASVARLASPAPVESAPEPPASASPPPSDSCLRGAPPNLSLGTKPRVDPGTLGTNGREAARAAAPKDSASSPADEQQALYRTAHRAHFEAHDWPAALAAWDAYLLRSPGGRFAPEAQYNRALCLVRLGRTADAQAALVPFAQGRYGAYRQREATALLEALGGQR